MVIEIINTTTKETKILLNGNEYYPDKNLLERLIKKMI